MPDTSIKIENENNFDSPVDCQGFTNYVLDPQTSFNTNTHYSNTWNRDSGLDNTFKEGEEAVKVKVEVIDDETIQQPSEGNAVKVSSVLDKSDEDTMDLDLKYTSPSDSGNCLTFVKKRRQPNVNRGKKKVKCPKLTKNLENKQGEDCADSLDKSEENIPKQKWVHIKLEDHADKFKVEKIDSVERKHRGTEAFEVSFCCLVCNKYKAVGKDVFEHHLECHINKEYECEACGFVGCSTTEMINHRRTQCQSALKEFICDVCGESVPTRYRQEHMGTRHDIAKFICRYCPEEFTTGWARKRHHRQVHPDLAQFCTICKRGFSNISR